MDYGEPFYYERGTQLPSESEYNEALDIWRSGWTEVDDYVSVGQMWTSMPLDDEIQELVASYPG